MTEKIFRINKIRAAGAQLDTAIELIFKDSDIISIAVLTHSSWSIIKDLLKQEGINTTREMLQSDYGVTYQEIDKIWNFAKHANKDPNHEIEFKESQVLCSLIMAIRDYERLHALSNHMNTYLAWFVSLYREIFITPDSQEVLNISLKEFPNLNSLPRLEQRKSGLKKIS